MIRLCATGLGKWGRRRSEGGTTLLCPRHATRRPLRRANRRDETRREMRRTYHPRERRRRPAAFSICLSALSYVLPIAKRHDRRDGRPNALLYISPPVHRCRRRRRCICRFAARNVTIIAHAAAEAGLPACPLVPLPLLPLSLSLFLPCRIVRARFIVLRRSPMILRYYFKRALGQPYARRVASRWTLSRAIVQSPAEIISASAPIVVGHRFRDGGVT